MKAWKTILAILCATALTVAAQPDRMHRGMELTKLLDDEVAVKKLGLTPEQVTTLKTRAVESQEQIVMLRASVELAERNLRQLMSADALNRNEIIKAVDVANKASAKLRTAMIEEQLAFAEIAGPETLRKARRMMGKQAKKNVGGKAPNKKNARRKK